MPLFALDLSELRSDYFFDLLDKLQKLEEYSLVLQTNRDQEVAKKIALTLHSIKGTSGSYDLDLISEISHQCESLIALDSDGQHLPEKLLKAIDVMRDLVPRYQKGEKLSADEYLKKAGLIKLEVTTKNVLIVDGSSVSQKAILNSLNGLPLHFSLCRDWFDAMWRVTKNRYDYVITSTQTEGASVIPFIGAISYLEKEKPQVILTTSNKSFLLPEALRPLVKIVIKDRDFLQNLRLEFDPKSPRVVLKSEKQTALKKKVIVVIDDDTSLLKLVEHFSVKHGQYELKLFSETEKALEFLKVFTPDLIVCDVHLGEQDGLEFARELKNFNIAEDVPFIFLTGSSEMPNPDPTLIKGIIAKPFTPATLFEEFASYLKL